jgi:hypothetical protein
VFSTRRGLNLWCYLYYTALPTVVLYISMYGKNDFFLKNPYTRGKKFGRKFGQKRLKMALGNKTLVYGKNDFFLKNPYTRKNGLKFGINLKSY